MRTISFSLFAAGLLWVPPASATTFFTDPVDQAFSGTEITGGSAGFDGSHLYLTLTTPIVPVDVALIWALDTDQDLSTGLGTSVVSNFNHQMHLGELLISYRPQTDGATTAQILDAVSSSLLGLASATVGPGSITIAVPYGPTSALKDPEVLFSVAAGREVGLGFAMITDVAPSGGTLIATPAGPATAVPEPAILLLLAVGVVAASRKH